jgi:signal transduction histidine kinase
MREKQSASNARISLLEHAQRLEKQIIEVSEYEQQRIGRDLHDGLCQFLAAIGCAATSLKIDLKEKGLDKLTANASEIEKLISESVKQARDLSHGLVPVQLNEAGLPAALNELAVSTSRLLPIRCTFEAAGKTGIGQNGKAAHLYRIAQEAIHNASKHSQAGRIDIRLSANESATSLSIADDGIGFPKNANAMNGVGISIMRYRANLMDGEFAIEAGAGGGTIVSCTVPAGVER